MIRRTRKQTNQNKSRTVRKETVKQNQGQQCNTREQTNEVANEPTDAWTDRHNQPKRLQLSFRLVVENGTTKEPAPHRVAGCCFCCNSRAPRGSCGGNCGGGATKQRRSRRAGKEHYVGACGCGCQRATNQENDGPTEYALLKVGLCRKKTRCENCSFFVREASERTHTQRRTRHRYVALCTPRQVRW